MFGFNMYNAKTKHKSKEPENVELFSAEMWIIN